MSIPRAYPYLPKLQWLAKPIACAALLSGAFTPFVNAEPISNASNSQELTLEEAKRIGAKQSSYKKNKSRPIGNTTPEPRLEEFQSEINPILEQHCFTCHGEDKQKADFRVDTLDPNLIRGGDVDWWLEVADVLGNGEMPPEDEEEMPGADRGKVIDWLSTEIQVASQARRSEGGHSSFRRLTRYEFNHALQDLLGLPLEFAEDLPPETYSEDGFQNSSEILQMTVMQFETYRDLSRKALEKATVRGDRPETRYYSIPMTAGVAKMKALYEADVDAAKKKETDPKKLEAALKRVEQRHRFNSNRIHFVNLETGKGIKSSFNYRGGRMSHLPRSEYAPPPPLSPEVLVIPLNEAKKMDLGDKLPDTGTIRIRVRASHRSTQEGRYPNLRLEFGSQPSNNSRTSIRVDHPDIAIDAPLDQPRFYEWTLHLSELHRNQYRGVTEMGDLPNPTEYITFQNSTQSLPKGERADILIDYLEVISPYYTQWPPESHRNLFIESDKSDDETVYAREVLANFMPKAWRRPVTDSEIERKLALFSKLRPTSKDFQEAMIEVLATVLSSPRFLYIVNKASAPSEKKTLSDYELATRLSLFLWSSVPDQELLDLAKKGKLSKPKMLARQTKRMLEDPRSQRFAHRFTRQWLGMQLLDHLDVEEETYPLFDNELKDAMQQEPIAFFKQVLDENRSIMDFLHADYALVNERLARHYGMDDIKGNAFRKVPFDAESHRGGLLTQAGLLAMNSDGKDSHPLKRGIWMLERLLNDPPPSPPAAVPEIDLTDPEIAKLTLKERIENHRNDDACMSCHAKIDPWGIAFENFDAVGSWRSEIDGTPVDATSLLFNNQELDGIRGLKRFLLENRQDQFARAIVYKLSAYALGRPLSFSDRADIEEITAQLRSKEDRLGDLISLIVTSELFNSI